MDAETRRGRNAAILGFLIFLVYASLRYLVYAQLPAQDFADWIIRDTIMDVLRALVLALSLVLGLRFWGKEGLGLHGRRLRPATVIFLSYFVVLWLPDYWLRSTREELGVLVLMVLSMSSLLVGLWEEVLYRGVFFNAIHDWKGARAAIWGSSLLFTVMHIQAQPLESWPSIFLCGLLFAVMRAEGIGLWWLIAIHATFDSLALFGATGEELVPGLSVRLYLMRALFVLAYYQATKPWRVSNLPQGAGSEEGASYSTSGEVPVDPTANGGDVNDPVAISSSLQKAMGRSEQESMSSPTGGIQAPAPSPDEASGESEERRRLRELCFLASCALEKGVTYRIRLHITQVEASGKEKDLGPWPDDVAQVSRLEDATDLCSMLSHHLSRLFFPKGRSH